MSKNPQFSEKVILDALDAITTVRSTMNLQAASKLSILDAFDRGIEREAFIDILQEALSLYTFTSRLSMVTHLKSICEQTGHGIEKNHFEQAVHEVTAVCEAHRGKLIKHMELVVQCPLEFDTLH